jgi:hypothetical protein
MTLNQRELEQKGYSKAEVEILVALSKLETNQNIIIQNYVKRTEFEPVQRIVYGLVALFLMAVAGGIIALVIP